MKNIVDTLAARFGLAVDKLSGYPDIGTLEIYGDSGLACAVGNVSGIYDFETRELFALQSFIREYETIESTQARFEKTVAEFEALLGMKAKLGICKVYSSGLFSEDIAEFADEHGEAYVYCHYYKAEGRGQVQFGARRLPAKKPETPDPFGKAYQEEWTDEVNAEIDARIEKYRKAYGAFPLPGPAAAGAKVKVEQIDSEFKIGCNIFNFNQLGDAGQNAEYRRLFSDEGVFNAATIAFYWKNIEPVKGRPRYWDGPEENEDYWKTHGTEDVAWRRPAIEGVLRHCEANGISVHGHVMVYPYWTAGWAYKEAGIRTGSEDTEKLQVLYDAHIAELGRIYGARISQWDVVNESVDRACTPDNVHDTLPWCAIPQPKDYTYRCFKTAEKSFPHDVKLCINDAYTGPSDNGRYPALTRKLLARGAKIDVIGHQMHIFHERDAVKVASGQTAYPNFLSWKIADQIAMFRQYDALGKPIHVSEVTIPAPVKLMPRDEAEALQARLLRDNYRLWFSWPSVYRITYWNAVDSVGGEILESGFLRRDMSKKPVYDTLWNLVHNEWRTRTEVVADENGVVRFRGFKGRYRLSWTDANGVANEQIVDLRDRKEVFITPAAPQPGPDSVAEFKRVLTLGEKPARVELRVAPLGIFRAWINGEEVAAEEFFKGGYTSETREKHILSYDVSEFVREGENEFRFKVAPCWWSDKVAKRNNSPGTVPALFAEIAVTGADARTNRVATDTADWLGGWAKDVVRASVYYGEDFTDTCEEAELGAVRESSEFVGSLVPRFNTRTIFRRDLTTYPLSGKSLRLEPGKEVVLDFGQNAAYVPELKFSCKAGTGIVIRTAEVLDTDGKLYRENLRSSRSEAHYRAVTDGEHFYAPRYTYFGYRYLSLEAEAPVEVEEIASVPVTDVSASADERGTIETGLPELNRLVQNCRWGLLSNYLSITTDCPQRDERVGWCGDAQTFAPAALYLTESRDFLSKFCRDIMLSQHQRGGFPPIAPFWNFDDEGKFGSATGWSDAGILIPYALWLLEGDVATAASSWNYMERYMASLVRDGRHDWNRFGDWLSFDRNDDEVKEYLSVAYIVRDAAAMKEMARGLGKAERAAYYAGVEETFRAKLKGMEMPDVPTCAAYARICGLDIPAEKIMPFDGTIRTGNLGTAVLLEALTMAGGVKGAYDLLLQRKCPGWLFMVDNGATTMWERWDSYSPEKGFGDPEMNSFNHYFFGSVAQWIFQTAAGIRPDPAAPGFRHFILAPQPDERLGYCRASYRSAAGLIESEWRFENGKCVYRFRIPERTTADLVLPGMKAERLYPGVYIR